MFKARTLKMHHVVVEPSQYVLAFKFWKNISLGKKLMFFKHYYRKLSTKPPVSNETPVSNKLPVSIKPPVSNKTPVSIKPPVFINMTPISNKPSPVFTNMTEFRISQGTIRILIPLLGLIRNLVK